MAMPPYMLGPPYMMGMLAQQQAQLAAAAAAQAQVQAAQAAQVAQAQAQVQAQVQAQQQQQQKPEYLSEEKLQEKGTNTYMRFWCYWTLDYICCMITVP